MRRPPLRSSPAMLSSICTMWASLPCWKAIREQSMAINYEQMMQSKSEGLEASYGDREVMLYALGIGFQRDPMDEAELRFSYEKDLVVVPTFATVIPTGRP